MNNWTPELLSPAGNLSKLKTAISYGADAVYAGGQKFGLRAAADNFTLQELEIGARFCHDHNSKMYIVLNSFLHDSDLESLPEFVDFLQQIKVDALIVSDLGVIKTIQKNSKLPIHLSTQASCLNTSSGLLWKNMGVDRLIVGREASIENTRLIKESVGLDVEMFIHGSMCMAYSGNCVISNFTQGRDSNRGGCAHSCRFEYSLIDEDSLEKRKAFFMSSKDLNGLRLLESYIKAGIDSIKVEGRMKSELYAGTISKVYSEALTFYRKNGHFYSNHLEEWAKELEKVTHREYAPVNLEAKAGAESIYNEREHEKSPYYNAGIVLDVTSDEVIIQVKNAVKKGQRVEVLPFSGEIVSLPTDRLVNFSRSEVEEGKPNSILRFPKIGNIEKYNIVRSVK